MGDSGTVGPAPTEHVEWKKIDDCGVPDCDSTGVATFPTFDRPEFFDGAERVCEVCLRGLTPTRWDDES